MTQSLNHAITQWPDANGRFGEFGGRFVPETLMHPVEELERAYEAARDAKKYATIILAGGLTPENVSNAIREVRPYAVDVASGVESSPGKKDSAKMRAFFAEVVKADETW